MGEVNDAVCQGGLGAVAVTMAVGRLRVIGGTAAGSSMSSTRGIGIRIRVGPVGAKVRVLFSELCKELGFLFAIYISSGSPSSPPESGLILPDSRSRSSTVMVNKDSRIYFDPLCSAPGHNVNDHLVRLFAAAVCTCTVYRSAPAC